jgi:fatty acid desaturase
MKRWALTFVVAALLSVALGYCLFWLLGGFEGLDIGVQGSVAIVLALTLIPVVGIGLMVLMLYSERGGYDEAASRPRPNREDGDRQEDS